MNKNMTHGDAAESKPGRSTVGAGELGKWGRWGVGVGGVGGVGGAAGHLVAAAFRSVAGKSLGGGGEKEKSGLQVK